MKIVSWNVNGLRASVNQCEGRTLKKLLDSLQADLICFQETKATRDQLDSSLYHVDGYKAFFSFCQVRKGYSGVVTFCRESALPVLAEEGLTGSLLSAKKRDAIGCYGDTSAFTEDELMCLDREGRAVLTEHHVTLREVGVAGKEVESAGRLVVVNVYCPMYDPARDKDGGGVSRLTVKTNFYKLLEIRVRALEKAGKLVVVSGDLNCCRETIDSAYALEDPKHVKDKDPTSLDWMSRFIVSNPHATCPVSSSRPSPLSVCLLDTFRYLHPTQGHAYTCWSTLLDCRKTNFGTRIDFILVSTCLAEHVQQGEVWQHVMGSDHCPVFAELDLDLTRPPSHQPPPVPSLCSDFFSGKQSKLFSFTKKTPATDNTKSRLENDVSPLQTSPRKPETPETSSPKGTKRPSKQSSSLPPAKKTAKASVQMTFSSFLSAKKDQPDGTASRPETKQPQKVVLKAASAKAKAPPPDCKGHDEPCVLKKVKKAGPNKDREFWVCARPSGSKSDPQARCDHFQWAS